MESGICDPKDVQNKVQKELTERQLIILKILLSDNSITLDQMSKRIYSGTQGGTQGGTQSDTQGDALDIWIEDQIRKNPKITTEELAEISKKGLRTIKRHIAKLAHIKYVGRGYSGHWEIIENNAET